MIPVDVTEDSLFGGRLKILQPVKGYRFALDAVLLAGLSRPLPDENVVDLGTGCGVIPLIFAYRNQGKSITGIEIQEALAELASRNVEINSLKNKVKILKGDFKKIREYLPPEEADLVVSNPPYRKVRTGRINPNEEKALARHEILGSVEDVLKAAKYLLKTKGRLATIYPAYRLAHLISAASKTGFEPKKLTVIYSAPGQSACLVYMEARKGGGEELHIDPPFYIYDASGDYSPQMKVLYE